MERELGAIFHDVKCCSLWSRGGRVGLNRTVGYLVDLVNGGRRAEEGEWES